MNDAEAVDAAMLGVAIIRAAASDSDQDFDALIEEMEVGLLLNVMGGVALSFAEIAAASQGVSLDDLLSSITDHLVVEAANDEI